MKSSSKKSDKTFTSGIPWPERPLLFETEADVVKMEDALKRSTQLKRWLKRGLRAWASQLMNYAQMHKQVRAAEKFELGVKVLERHADVGVDVAKKKQELAVDLIDETKNQQISAAEQRFSDRKAALQQRFQELRQRKSLKAK